MKHIPQGSLNFVIFGSDLLFLPVTHSTMDWVNLGYLGDVVWEWRLGGLGEIRGSHCS